MDTKIFSGPVNFLKSAPSLEFLPDATVPEIAFAGRSNVGKSSLINALVNRNGLARASNTPGAHAGTQLFRCRRAADIPHLRHAGLWLRQGTAEDGAEMALSGE
jgi:GTP-binding protein EngB required for normal cell division